MGSAGKAANPKRESMMNELLNFRNSAGTLLIALASFLTAILSSDCHAQSAIPADPPATGTNLPTPTPVSLEVAKDRARLMSEIYLATLEVMHDRYFHRERAVLPARAMEDIFAEINRQSKIETRWISASLKPMSVNHEPKTDFEKRASQEIAQGQTDVEVVEASVYRRAVAVPLGSSCINCHTGFFKEPSKSPQFAGLVISIPVTEAAAKP
jgi:hypothetical protein